MLPDAWLFDSEPLPPQAVIPRMELSGWGQLPTLRDSGRSFVLTNASGDGWSKHLNGALPSDDWESALREFSGLSSGRIVEENRYADAGQVLAAIYHRSSERVEMAGLFALEKENEDWTASQVA
jgi:hypothetical protein